MERRRSRPRIAEDEAPRVKTGPVKFEALGFRKEPKGFLHGKKDSSLWEAVLSVYGAM